MRRERTAVPCPGVTRSRRLEAPDVLRGQDEIGGGGVLLRSLRVAGAGDRNDVFALREQPDEGELVRRRPALAGQAPDGVDEGEIAFDRGAGEALVTAAEVAAGESA